VAKGPPKLIVKAFALVEARNRVTRPGVRVPFDEFLYEVTVEFCALAALRAEKHRRKIRKAARRVREDGKLIAALAEPPVSAGEVPEELPAGWDGVPGPPRWHPEHRLNSDN